LQISAYHILVCKYLQDQNGIFANYLWQTA
jgi:hypothetical protein